MKLAEILAEKLGEWADTTKYYAQDRNGDVYPWVTKPRFYNGLWEQGSPPEDGIDQNPEALVYNTDLASDWDEALVTKEMWLAEKGVITGDVTQTLSTGGGTSGHIHAESMKLYAEDAAETEKPWERWQTRKEGEREWVSLAVSPAWYTDKEYRRKPTTITIGGEEVPEPVREPLKKGEPYWVISMYCDNLAHPSRWDCGIIDMKRLRLGMVHRTKEAAAAHTKALIKVSGGEI